MLENSQIRMTYKQENNNIIISQVNYTFNFTVQQGCTTLQMQYLYLWNEVRSPVKSDHNT